MEKVSVAVVASVLFHAVVVSAALAYEPPKRCEPTGAAPIQIELIPAPVLPAPSEPLEVAMLDDSEIEAAAQADAIAPRKLARASISTSATHVDEVQPQVEPPGAIPPTRNPLLDMRRKRADLSIRPEYRDALDHAPAGSAPAVEVAPTGQLDPSGGGTYRSNQGTFSAKVGQDGSVKLKDAKNFNIHIPDPRKLAKLPKMIGQGISDWYAQEDKTPGDTTAQPLRSPGGEQDTKPDSGGTVPILGGGFDVSDALMRRHGQDPYASKKLKYLDSTRAERVQIGTKYRKAQLAQSTQLVQKNIDYLWSRTQDPAARKRGLFELWDDCAETGDASLVEGGRAARQLVLGVIRSKFPAGSAQAFTAAELAALNAKRQSKAAFAPYE
jgi:hypothetical protein